jgi:hypothetical protein
VPVEAFVARVQARLSRRRPGEAGTREEVLAAVDRMVGRGLLRRLLPTSGPALYQFEVAYVPPPGAFAATRDSGSDGEEAAATDAAVRTAAGATAGADASALLSCLTAAAAAAEARGDGAAAWVAGPCSSPVEAQRQQLGAALAMVRRRVETLACDLSWPPDDSTAFALLERSGWDVGRLTAEYRSLGGPPDYTTPAAGRRRAHAVDSPVASLCARYGVPLPREKLCLMGFDVLERVKPSGEEGAAELCPCCYTEPVAVRMPLCGHGACTECIVRMAIADMEEGKLPLTCLALVEEDEEGPRADSRLRRCQTPVTMDMLRKVGLGSADEVFVWGWGNFLKDAEAEERAAAALHAGAEAVLLCVEERGWGCGMLVPTDLLSVEAFRTGAVDGAVRVVFCFALGASVYLLSFLFFKIGDLIIAQSHICPGHTL